MELRGAALRQLDRIIDRVLRVLGEIRGYEDLVDLHVWSFVVLRRLDSLAAKRIGRHDVVVEELFVDVFALFLLDVDSEHFRELCDALRELLG
jgi:hypothetical protein